MTKEQIKKELKQLDLGTVKGAFSDLEFMLWDLDEQERWNKDYNVSENHNGHYAIGSDGGGEMLTVELNSGAVFMIPFISIDNSEKIKVSDSILELTRTEK